MVAGIAGQNYHRSRAAYIGVYADSDEASFPIILDEPFLAIQMPPYPAFEVIIGRDILMKEHSSCDPTAISNGDLPIG